MFFRFISGDFPTKAFVIKHFSDTVQYQSTGFLEKNRDTISKELVNVMRESNLTICHTLMILDNVTTTRNKETSLDGRVKINAAKHLVKHSLFISLSFFPFYLVLSIFLYSSRFAIIIYDFIFFLRKSSSNEILYYIRLLSIVYSDDFNFECIL